LSRPVRNRRPLALLAAGGLVAAAAAVALGIVLTEPKRALVTITTQPTAPPSSVATATTLAPSRPTTTIRSATVTTPTTSPRLPVPADFQPRSVTFVSATVAWVLGTVPCGVQDCADLAHTTDGGLTWTTLSGPPITFANVQSSDPAAGASVRFVNGLDGWIYTSRPQQPVTGLWATHDGGATWAAVADPAGAGAQIADLEASDGRAQLVTIPTSGQGENIFTAAAGSEEWVASPITLGLGAGPVPSAQIVLQGSTGWIIDNDRTVTGGAHLSPSAGWSTWTPPCSNAMGEGFVAASSATDLAAVCAEGIFGPPAPGTTTNSDWLYTSRDGGSSFTAVGALPGSNVTGITAAPGPASTIVAADSRGLVATFDTGRSWTTVYPTTSTVIYAGFTTATQAVAVVDTSGGGTSILMTHDGGHTWTPVRF
jgi:hypothetical protein